jgi:hypothetical protein
VPKPSPDPDPIYTAEQAAAQGSWTERSIKDAINRGDLRASLPNGRRGGYRIRHSWLLEWIDSHEISRDPSARSDDQGEQE